MSIPVLDLPDGRFDYPHRPCGHCGKIISQVGPHTYEFNPILIECESCGGTNMMGYDGQKFIWRPVKRGIS